MPLQPIENTYWHTRAPHVRIYLDDIENVAASLAALGGVEITLQRRQMPDVRIDSVDDLIGRPNIQSITVAGQTSTGMRETASAAISALEGVKVTAYPSDHAAKAVVEHFIQSLDQLNRRWWQIGPFRPHNDAELVLGRRASESERREQRRHDLRISLWSAAAGTLFGAVATLLTAFL